MKFTIGILFDGSGGFPLAATLAGGQPTWAAEVEPYPVAVTRSRFPQMQHLGSVTDVHGDKVKPVDVITFGSPCQDLSVAGKRAGLKHEENGDEETTRSGLFMEAVRIIKEMREATNGRYPTFAVWENVPGAFSSNKGEDFRTVLHELIKIAEPTATVPTVPKGGWPYADSYCGDGWSIAYRVFDAQYWGVPQRRRRIYLVADFRGERARKVLFEREGLRGYFAEGRTPWQATARDAQDSAGADDREGESAGYRGGRGLDAVKVWGIDHAITTGGNCTAQGPCVYEDIQATLKASGPHAVAYAIDQQGGKGGANYAENVMPTLCSDSHGTPHAVAYSFDSLASNSMKSSNPHSGCRQVEVSKTLDTTDPNPSKNQGGTAIVEPVPYTLKIRSGVAVDSAGKAAGKGALIQTNLSATLGTSQDQYLFQPVSIENHPADSRVNIDDSGKMQTLPSRMGTGGGNVPMVMEPVPIHDQATRFSGKRGDKQDGKGNGLGVGAPGDPMNTLTAGDRHAVAYAMQGFGDYKDCGVASGLKARDYKDATDLVAEAQPIAIDRAFFNQGQNALYDPQYYTDGTNPTLVARGPSAVAVRYIARRLTPTECARLQGFPDKWGHPDQKETLTDEEYAFWKDARNTHAAINGKQTRDYTKEQMLKWYNGLHTDSAEYKMWGNGIALPCALYVMQGIADAMEVTE